MNRWLRWAAGVLWGAMATLFTSFGFPLALAVLVLGVVLLKADRVVAISGPLAGFGMAWLLWLWRQSLTGGTMDGSTWPAVMFGLLPLLIGVALVMPSFVGWIRHTASVRH